MIAGLLALVAGLMGAVMLSPLRCASVFVLFRPLMQAASIMHIPFLGLPTTAVHSFILLAAAAFSLFRRHGRLFIRHTILLYIIVAYSLISLRNTTSMYDSLGGVLKILTALALFLLVYNGIRTYRQGITFLKASAYCALLPTLFGVAQWITGKWSLANNLLGSRVTSTIGIANAYGIFLSFVTIPVIILILLRVNRRVNIFILGLIIVNQVLAQNRGTWLAFSTALILSSLFYFKRVKIKYVVLSFLLIGILFSGIIAQRFMQLSAEGRPNTRYNTLELRVRYWKAILPVIMDEPVIGHGIGEAQTVSERLFRSEAVPHNDYIRFALEIGIPGTLFYVLFLFLEFTRNAWLMATKRRWQINYPMFALIMYFIVISMTQNVYFSTVNFPIFLSLMAMSMRMNEVEWEPEEPDELEEAKEPEDAEGGPPEVEGGHTHAFSRTARPGLR